VGLVALGETDQVHGWQGFLWHICTWGIQVAESMASSERTILFLLSSFLYLELFSLDVALVYVDSTILLHLLQFKTPNARLKTLNWIS
jgi:hypothetical protein